MGCWVGGAVGLGMISLHGTVLCRADGYTNECITSSQISATGRQRVVVLCYMKERLQGPGIASMQEQ